MNLVSDTVSDLQSNSLNVIQQIRSKLTLDNFIKYLLQGLSVAFAVFLIPNRKTTIHEIAVLAIVAGLTFMVLDTFTEDIAKYARLGVGAGIGFGLANLNPGNVVWLNSVF